MPCIFYFIRAKVGDWDGEILKEMQPWLRPPPPPAAPPPRAATTLASKRPDRPPDKKKRRVEEPKASSQASKVGGLRGSSVQGWASGCGKRVKWCGHALLFNGTLFPAQRASTSMAKVVDEESAVR